jgi:hypothetical protein
MTIAISRIYDEYVRQGIKKGSRFAVQQYLS